MVEIKLIGILPPQPVQGVQPLLIPQGALPSPYLLAALPPGSVLSGFIVNRDPTGNPILRTDKGDIAFATSFFLKIGSEVVIRLENRAGKSSAHILSVNGQPPEVAETQSGFAKDPEIILSSTLTRPQTTQPAQPVQPAQPPQQTQQPAPTQAAPSPTTPSAAATVQVSKETLPPLPVTSGVVISLPSAPAATAPAVPVGTQISFRIVSVTTPTPEAGAQPATPAPAIPASYAAYTRTAAATPSSPIPTIQPTALSVTLPATPVTETATATPAPVTAGQTIVATAVGKEPTGETLVQTHFGVVRLQSTNLPQNSVLRLEVRQITPPAENAILRPAPLTELARQWTSLQQIASLLSTVPNASVPWQAVDIGQPHAPMTAKHISTGLMLFISALRGGSFSNWLGEDNVKWLHTNGHELLVKKAEAEFMSMARPFTEAPVTQSQQWQSLFFPVAVEGQLQQVRMFLKRDRRQDKKDPDKKEEDTRFVVEVSLSQMGEMQMDGFVRRKEKVEFDLFIRSHTPLEAQAQQDILAIYNNIGEMTGYRGSLVFQAVKEFPVKPMEEMLAQGSGSLMA